MNWQTQPPRNSDPASDEPVQPEDGRPEQPKDAGWKNIPPRKTWLTFLIILLINYMLMKIIFPEAGEALTIPYTTFKEEVAKGNVKSIYSHGASIEGRFAAPVTWPPEVDEKTSGARRPSEPEPQTADTFTTDAARVRGPRSGGVPDRQQGRDQRRTDPGGRLLGHAPVRLRSGAADHRVSTSGCSGAPRSRAAWAWAGSWASARARRAATTRTAGTKVTFDDVAGIDEAENELVEIVDFLQGPGEVHPPGRHARRKACCWSARRAPARRCWRRPSPGKPACRSSR